MIYKEHLVELWVNGKKVDLEDQKSLNLRFNNVLFDPTKISSTQAEYSFEFSVPATPNNNKIFDYANNLAKTNKFHQRYNADVYADGSPIFSGTITINSHKDKEYRLNLVSVKVNSIEDIFGDDVMTSIRPMQRDANGAIKKDEAGSPLHEKWSVDFSGVTSINSINSQLETDVVFPLVSYGCFPKVSTPAGTVLPASRPIYYGNYTSKFDFDKYNLWYYTSFYPSHNMLATLKNAFETKDYVVGGDVFNNPYLKNIYMSVNLADGQVPNYNIGNPVLGTVDLSVSWTCPQDVPPASMFDFGTSYGTVSELKFPYLKSGDMYWDLRTGDAITVDPDYNLDKIRIYDMMLSGDGGTVTRNNTSYMFNDTDNCIVIPQDGFYRITMTMNSNLTQSSDITAKQWVHEWDDNITAMTLSVSEKDITFHPDFKITTPLEIQLVKNWTKSDDTGIELIKGKNNFRCNDGYPDNETEMNKGRYANYRNWTTCFPHEKMGVSNLLSPTKTDEFAGETMWDATSYVYNDNELMCYDPVVSDKFICGFSSMGNKLGGGTGAVIKNGKSWAKQVADTTNYSFYEQQGYMADANGSLTRSSKNANTYPGSNVVFSQTNNTMNGTIKCLVYLKKDDVLRLLAIHRDYETTAATKVSYATNATVSLKVEAASPNTYSEILARMNAGRYTYNSPSEFDIKLNLAEFFNNEKKIADWVKNVVDAFNFDVIQNGNTVTINSRRKLTSDLLTAVDIDDRVNSSEAESSKINYPREMAVKYKIDTDEWGAEKSAIEANGGDDSIMNDDGWKKYIDSGYTVITLNDDTFETSKSEKSLQFSYTWYDNFDYYSKGDGEAESETPVTLRIPVISKFSYMIDGYDYEESRKHDGYGLSQRFWFRPRATNALFKVRIGGGSEDVVGYEPTNLYTNYQDVYFNLSYKNTEPSILTEFFNINAYLASNYVEVEVYLSPEEYNRIKNGALIHFDSDLYIPVDIGGYDPTNFNPTSLKMMKKVI